MVGLLQFLTERFSEDHEAVEAIDIDKAASIDDRRVASHERFGSLFCPKCSGSDASELIRADIALARAIAATYSDHPDYRPGLD